MRLAGAKVAEQITEDLIDRCERLKQMQPDLKIAIFRVGENPDDIAYEKRVLKNCMKVGLGAEVISLEKEITQEALLQKISQYNQAASVSGILVFRPLPKHLDEQGIGEIISPEKDIDCMNPRNLQKLLLGEKDRIAPCTPEAVMELIQYYGIALQGKHVAIVNRSMVLGKPLALLFLERNATVTICHSKTENLKEITAKADIVVTGVGKANYFGKEYFKKEAVVIDVGINFTSEGMCGDVDYEAVKDYLTAITPVPGGVGAVTSMVLLRHALQEVKR